MKRTTKLLNLLLSGLACALANKLRPAPVTSEDDKEPPMIFKIRRWRMRVCHKMCIALGSVCFLLSCSGPLQQTTQQIQCTGSIGQILYAGPYSEESKDAYIVQMDTFTQAVYRKGACRRLQA